MPHQEVWEGWWFLRSCWESQTYRRKGKLRRSKRGEVPNQTWRIRFLSIDPIL